MVRNTFYFIIFETIFVYDKKKRLEGLAIAWKFLFNVHSPQGITFSTAWKFGVFFLKKNNLMSSALRIVSLFVHCLKGLCANVCSLFSSSSIRTESCWVFKVLVSFSRTADRFSPSRSVSAARSIRSSSVRDTYSLHWRLVLYFVLDVIEAVRIVLQEPFRSIDLLSVPCLHTSLGGSIRLVP